MPRKKQQTLKVELAQLEPIRHPVEYPCSIQPKYEGIRCFVSVVNKVVTLVDKSWKTLVFEELTNFLSQFADNDYYLDGVIVSGDLSQAELIEALSVKQTLNHPLTFIYFDYYDKTLTYKRRQEIGHRSVTTTDICKPTIEQQCWCTADLLRAVEGWTEAGYKQFVVRNLDSTYNEPCLLVSQFEEDFFTIVRLEETQELIPVVICCTNTEDLEEFIIELTPEAEQSVVALQQDALGRALRISYQSLSESGIPQLAVGRGVAAEV